MKPESTGSELIRSEIPILEYDPVSVEIIRANHNMEELVLPEVCVFPFLGDVIDTFAESHGAKIAETIHTITKEYPIYVVRYKGRDITLCQAPLGGPAAVSNLDNLIACGVRKIISAGSCGVLTERAENAFLIPVKALRAEGTSYHYLPPARFIELDRDMISEIERVLTARSVHYAECVTWTTDGFFRETEEMVAYRRDEGCSVVEMECASLAACARLRGAKFGQILFTADTLADPDHYDPRDWGRASYDRTIGLMFEIAAEL